MPGVIVPEKIPLGGEDPQGRPPGRIRRPVILGAILVAACGAAVLVFEYPGRSATMAGVGRHPDPTGTGIRIAAAQDAVALDQPVPEPEIVPAVFLLEREFAEDRLGEFVAMKRELDAKAVLEWGGEAYADVLALSASADAAFVGEDYVGAAKGYEASVAGCRALAEQAPEAFTQLLEAGRVALREANREVGRRKFQAALKIEPSSPEASEGLRRSETIEEVDALLKSGAAHERSMQNALALTDFQEAAELDPLHLEAVDALARVTERIRQVQFRALMTDVLLAIDGENLDVADMMIQEAKNFYPDSREVADAAFRSAERRRLVRIRSLMESARVSEAAEEWEQAYDCYGDTLEIDPHIREAAEGRGRMERRLRLLEHMKYYLGHEEGLLTEQARDHSASVLAEARQLSGGTPKWRKVVASFEQVVIAATTPVPVLLASDGQTHVDVYRVGRFGVFDSKELSLLPGTYTVVGHRKGFKDVRLKVRVDAGSNSTRTTVICRDPI